MKLKNMLKSMRSLFVVASVLPVLLAGCANTGVRNPTTGKRLVGTSVEHTFERNASAGKSASGKKAKLYRGTGVMVKSPKSMVIPEKGGKLTLSFEGADLREVVKTIFSDILNKSYIMDPRVGGTITLHTRGAISKSAVLPMLETVLRMNGAVLLHQEDGIYQIVPSNLAGKGNLTPRLGEPGESLPSGYNIVVVPLKYIGAEDMAKLLEPMGFDKGAIRTDPLRNLLILSGSEPELRHMLETIDMFDVNWIAGMSIGFFPLQNADAKTVLDELDKVFGNKKLGVLAGALRIVPLEKLNALLVVTPQSKYLDMAKTWIERLDRAAGGGGGQRLYVYRVQNGKAEKLANLLNQAFGGSSNQKSTPAPRLAPGLTPTTIKSKKAEATHEANAATTGNGVSLSGSGHVRIIADKDNNDLVIVASPADYDSIIAALDKLDVPPRQVLIEATFVSVKLTGDFQYGLDWAINNGPVSSQMNLSGIVAATKSFSYSWTSSTGRIKAVLNALASDQKVKVISSPHITVSDNQTASIDIGNQVPTLSQTESTSTTTTGIIQSVQYLDTGVQLTVTPHVNAGGQVTMDIDQEVSSAAKTDTSTINSPTIQKNSAKSTVVVQSGQTLIMAGLISNTHSTTSSGLPLLSKIPLLGGLFGSQDNSNDRTELIILITPRVLNNPAQATEITNEYRRRIPGLEGMLSTLKPHLYKFDADLGRQIPAKTAPLKDAGPVLLPPAGSSGEKTGAAQH